MSEVLKATCHCGRIELLMPFASVGVLACHCADCQKLHGNFNAFLVAARDAVSLRGEAYLVWYQSSAESRRAFCRMCGSRLLKEQTAAGRWLISAGLVDGPTGKHIIRNLWAESKPDWYDLPTAGE